MAKVKQAIFDLEEAVFHLESARALISRFTELENNSTSLLETRRLIDQGIFLVENRLTMINNQQRTQSGGS